jgi:PIN domain nuclease of toxin-antitoxin system
MLLMDTHTWFWSLTEPEKLSEAAFRLIQPTKPDQRAVSSISFWEFAMMVERGLI